MGRFLHHLWWIPWMNSVLSPSQVVQDFLHQFISWRIGKVCSMFSYTKYIYMYHIYGSMFILYMYVFIIIHIDSPIKYTLANVKPPFSKQGNTSTFHRREVMGWNLFASVSQQVYRRRRKYVRLCSRFFVTVRWHCLHIYHILLHNVSKLFFRHVCC